MGGKYKKQNQRTQIKIDESLRDEMKKIRQDLANLTVEFRKK